ncbi:hypothetical protein PV379_06615 [Streptomyces caniscabiei]|nr:hypothetical protein [Streptomyces caniscabiei]MDX2776992.1 hypothetical protein [Streptomyces caniscabiei]
MPRHKSPTRRSMLRATVARTERTSPSFVTLLTPELRKPALLRTRRT